jgi:GT2 family glycosyltransferase
MSKVQIFITHWVSKDVIELNDALIEQVTFLEKMTDYPHETIVVYYCPDGDNSDVDLRDRLSPLGTKLVKNDRHGRSDTQNSLRNKIIDLAEDLFVILHNDVRVSIGWLTNLVAEIETAEKKYGKGNCILSPRFIPYHYIPGSAVGFAPKYPKFWQDLEKNVCCLSVGQMRDWCRQWKFSFDGRGFVNSLPIDRVTDDGHALMMFISRKSFFNVIGCYDERYIGINYDDNDMGIIALMKGKKNLKSQTSLIGHIQGLSFCSLNIKIRIMNNDNIFIEKWGRGIWEEMQNGSLWIRLHIEQHK